MSGSNYAKQMSKLAANIFGEVKRPTSNSNMKVVKMFAEQPHYKQKEVVDYYPQHTIINRLFIKLRHDGLLR